MLFFHIEFPYRKATSLRPNTSKEFIQKISLLLMCFVYIAIIVFLVAIGVNVNLIKGKIGLHILAATTTEQMTGEHSISPASEYRVLCRESILIFIFHKWKPFNKCKRMLLLVKNWKPECSFTS